MSEKFNAPDAKESAVVTPAELERRLKVLNEQLAEYNAFINSMGGSDKEKKHADEMLAAIQAEKHLLQEAIDPDPFKVALREKLASKGKYDYVSAFTEGGVALAHKKNQWSERSPERVVDIITKDGVILGEDLFVLEGERFSEGLLRTFFPNSRDKNIFVNEQGEVHGDLKGFTAFDIFENGLVRLGHQTTNGYYVGTAEGNIHGAFQSVERRASGEVVARLSDKIVVFRSAKKHVELKSAQSTDDGKYFIETQMDGQIFINRGPALPDLGPVEMYFRSFDGAHVVMKDSLKYLLFENNKMQGPFDRVDSYNDGVAVVIKDGKAYFHNVKTDTSYGPYREVREFSGGVGWVNKKSTGINIFSDNWVAVTRDGREIEDWEHHLEYDADGYARVMGPEKQKFYRTRGTAQRPVEVGSFPRGYKFKNGLAVIKYQNIFEAFTKDGKEYRAAEFRHMVGDVHLRLSDRGIGRVFTPERSFDADLISAFVMGGKYIDIRKVAVLGEYRNCMLLNVGLTPYLGPYVAIYGESEGFMRVGDFTGDNTPCDYFVELATGRKLGPYESSANSVVHLFEDGVARVVPFGSRDEVRINALGKVVFKPKTA